MGFLELAGLITVGVELLMGLIGVGGEAVKTRQEMTPPACVGGLYRSTETGECEAAGVAEPVTTPVLVTAPSRDCRNVPLAEVRECMLGPGR